MQRTSSAGGWRMRCGAGSRPAASAAAGTTSAMRWAAALRLVLDMQILGAFKQKLHVLDTRPQATEHKLIIIMA